MTPDAGYPFAGLPRAAFACIVADPPWRFVTYGPGGKGRSPEQHYPTMDLAAISALPVATLAAPDCALLLWAVDPMLPAAMALGEAWGFAFKTVGFYWAKTDGRGGFPMGTGYWTRANPETCLLFTRGAPRRYSRAVPRLIVSPRREHSRKPEEAFERTEQLLGGPYLELFSRTSRPGWAAWGRDVGMFDREAL